MKEEYKSNENRLSGEETKADIEIFLVHEKSKHEQREKEVDLK